MIETMLVSWYLEWLLWKDTGDGSFGIPYVWVSTAGTDNVIIVEGEAS